MAVKKRNTTGTVSTKLTTNNAAKKNISANQNTGSTIANRSTTTNSAAQYAANAKNNAVNNSTSTAAKINAANNAISNTNTQAKSTTMNTANQAANNMDKLNSGNSGTAAKNSTSANPNTGTTIASRDTGNNMGKSTTLNTANMADTTQKLTQPTNFNSGSGYIGLNDVLDIPDISIGIPAYIPEPQSITPPIQPTYPSLSDFLPDDGNRDIGTPIAIDDPLTDIGYIGTTVNAIDPFINTSLQHALEEQAQTLDPNTFTRVADEMVRKANENPADTTNRYSNLLRGLTGNNTRPYSNPNFPYSTTNNSSSGKSRNITEDEDARTINDIMRDYNLRSLAENGYVKTTNNPINALISGTPFVPSSAVVGDDFANRMKGNGDIGNTNNSSAYEDRMKGNGDTWINGGDNYSDEDYSYSDDDYSGGGGTRGIGGGTPYVEDVGSTFDINALYELLNQQLAEYQNQYNSLLEALNNNYNASNTNLENYYQALLEALNKNYSDTEGLLNGQYSNSQQALEDQRKRALQEAYIARMLQEKGLADQLDAYGLSGGASESVLANLRNNYMNNRNSVEQNTQTSLKDLLQSYLSDTAKARQSYNQSLADAEQARLNARQTYANNLAQGQADAANYLAQARSGAYENLFNTLARLALNQ